MKSLYSGFSGRFVERLLGRGRFTFTREEFARGSRRTPASVAMAIHRLIRAGWLATPRRGFYIVVDPQHRSAGTLPPEWFIRDLMNYVAIPYYVGLLSAAQVYGSAHHRPREFQVVIPRRTVRAVRAGNVHIRFYGKGPFDLSQTREIKTPTGSMKVSTPETTAWDIVRYFKAAGGLEHVVTVLAELGESLDAKRLEETARRHGEIFVAQRLGYLLDRIGHRDLSNRLADMVANARFRPLDPGATVADARENRRWRLLVNVDLESEA